MYILFLELKILKTVTRIVYNLRLFQKQESVLILVDNFE